ncbi:1bed780c-1914-4f58-812b-d0afbe267ce5 [Sclerotinia trifoliorum]|uniref:1bed780c-1914-4f58-812b-d0afbe267ce5 n=1 Tax=Sclerotinia trifoliorum TaxID=28548 RepID=A0A8H2VXY7_9HELO|nr:1bed780c-1914-4f58-812b-d0afbe267ce5 [Sclerotinia trifoliorum]
MYSIGNVVVVAAAASSFYLLSYAIYNLFFHPLKSYPGPKLWVVCRFPITYYKIKGNLPQKIKELHDQYGDVVRIAPHYLQYNTSEAFEDIYGFVKGHHKKNFDKDLTERGPGPNQPIHIANSSGENHRRLRRVQTHAFSDKALVAQEPLIQEYAREFISGLIKFSSLTSDNSIDLGEWYTYTTFDLIGDLAFGESFKCVETGQMHPWIEIIKQVLSIDFIVNELAHYPFVRFLFRLLIPSSLLNGFNEHRKLAGAKAERRMNSAQDRPDFMSFILKHNDTDKGMTLDEIRENASVLIIAGGETTATLLNGLTYFLLQTPTALQNLTIELRSAFKTQKDITLNALAACKYLGAVVDEALRIYPPGPGTLPRVVPEDGGIVAGRFVPAGAIVGVSYWAAHHSPKNFHLAEEFHPERWLSSQDVEELRTAFPDMKLADPKIFENDDKKAKKPFSLGPSNCIGKNLAYAEIRTLIANVVWSFDLEGGKEISTWLERSKMFTTWRSPELRVKLKRVNV